MNTRAQIGLFMMLTAGVGISLSVQISHDGSGGSTIEVRVKPAAPACANSNRCLPDVPWLDTYGVTHTKADLAGKVVVVNFWATWCQPCERELPDFVRVATRYRNQVVILGVMMDNPPPDENTLLDFMSDHGLIYSIIPVTQGIQLAFHDPKHYPTTYIFDCQGNERVWKIRPMSESELSEVIEGILQEGSAEGGRAACPPGGETMQPPQP